MENFAWSFQIQILLEAFLVSAAIWFGVTSNSDSALVAGRRLAIAVTCGVLATLTLASGAALWPILALAPVVFGQPRRVLITFAVAGTLTVGLFFIGYRFEGGDIAGAFKQPLQPFLYFVLYVGNAWGFLGRIPGYMIGTIGCAAIVGVLAHVLAHRQELNSFQMFTSTLIVFCVVTAALTDLGRVKFGLDQAASGRYQTFGLILWTAIAGFAVSDVSEQMRRRAVKEKCRC